MLTVTKGAAGQCVSLAPSEPDIGVLALSESAKSPTSRQDIAPG